MVERLTPAPSARVRAAVDLVPEPIRAELGLEKHGLSRLQRMAVITMGKTADRIQIRGAPPSQASLRMERDAAYLYKR
jgi:uncharacterized protein (DUF2236 family)